MGLPSLKLAAIPRTHGEPSVRRAEIHEGGIVYVRPQTLYYHDPDLLDGYIYVANMYENPWIGPTQGMDVLVFIPSSVCSGLISWSGNGIFGFYAAHEVQLPDASDTVYNAATGVYEPKVKSMYMIIDNSWVIR